MVLEVVRSWMVQTPLVRQSVCSPEPYAAITLPPFLMVMSTALPEFCSRAEEQICAG